MRVPTCLRINNELVKVTDSSQMEFEIDEIVYTLDKDGIKHFVKWRGYMSFNSWVNATDIKKI